MEVFYLRAVSDADDGLLVAKIIERRCVMLGLTTLQTGANLRKRGIEIVREPIARLSLRLLTRPDARDHRATSRYRHKDT
jgi:hypothetical protein